MLTLIDADTTRIIVKPEKADVLAQMTSLCMQAIEGRFQDAEEGFRHYILSEVRKGLNTLPKMLASTLPPKNASTPEGEPDEPDSSGNAMIQQDKIEVPKPVSETPTVTNDEGSSSSSTSTSREVEYCSHTEGRIRYPNLACKECQRNFDFEQNFYMGLGM